ncbi:MAG: glycosyltransferase family 2 protein, partial [Faecousia sp.]
VIVPIYKVEPYLPKCVQSILDQTHSNLEIILVDDGSPDGCGAICDAFAAKDSRVRVIHKKNGGLSDARNAGIDIAKGDYFAFVDSDDWLESDAYEVMLALANKYDAKMVCAGRFDEDGASGLQTKGLCPEREEFVPGKELVRRIFRWDHLDSAAWDKLYARELFQDIRYPVGRVVEDVPTTYRLVLLAGGAAMLPKPVYHYLHREQSITNTSVSEKSFHAPQHAAQVYEDICRTLPELEPDARYFLTMSQKFIVQTLDLTDKATRQKFAGEHAQYRRALRSQLPFVMGYDLFSARSRAEVALTAFGLFPAAVNTGRFLKRMRKGL